MKEQRHIYKDNASASTTGSTTTTTGTTSTRTMTHQRFNNNWCAWSQQQQQLRTLSSTTRRSKSSSSAVVSVLSLTTTPTIVTVVMVVLMLVLSQNIHTHTVVGLSSVVDIIPKHQSRYYNILNIGDGNNNYRSSLTFQTTTMRTKHYHSRTTITFATMYLPDDWVDDDDHDRMTSSSSQSQLSSSKNHPMMTIPSILQSPEWVAPLARIAAEYTKRWNQSHQSMGQINVQQIERVSVTNVASSHVDIEAIVCDNEACVSLSVPVPFVQPCDVPSIVQQQQHQQERDKAFEDCVMRNIQELDTVQLKQQHQMTITNMNDNNAMENSHQQQQQQQLIDHRSMATMIEYPSWWIYPGQSIEFAKECQSLLHILNEIEFKNEITTLVTNELYGMLQIHPVSSVSESILQIESAIAVAVGPRGIIFRVTALYEQQYEIVDVPIAFHHTSSSSSSDRNLLIQEDPIALRNAVLHCIDHANQ